MISDQAKQARENNNTIERTDSSATDQKLRKRRLGMSFISYQVTLTIVVLCWYFGMVPLRVVFEFLAFSLLINAGFFLLIHFNLNLRFKDPAMTGLQMVISLLPPIWVMYFLEDGQARAVFLLIAMVPALYGILALRTREFLLVGLWFFLLYGALMSAIWITKPEVLMGSRSVEVIQMLGFMLVMGQIAMIGGFISGLRGKLRERNQELQDAMQRIRELVNIDELTGVFNRRRLFEVLSEESNRYSRTQGPFSICILDIDYFKQVNDTYGHQAGDNILRTVAQTVNHNLRQIDCFGRYGGEEFLLVLPQTPLDGACIKADRVRQNIHGLPFDHIKDGLRVSVSLGVAQYREGETIEDTIARADEALYVAKQQGRNRIVSEDQLPGTPTQEVTSNLPQSSH
ncbi:GGDEF domain-containing protein [Marinobacter nanhaiticus D15-8W]|uniref:diguanylate cyclase n=1 Tax=Marinobacter nanhaiticus D15-8W TaxID=626887 RepID=N6W092_9GAMM|nr:diguanylate cyclase [Marinobacter nanhaiticus]ENO13544.1 GGDEF domain-containing protein [Marinobacter nanhaiticus D15-8W]BES70913.1 GGDEF domain-containing protein [Marinobacter nanhaiticus D15-8W]